MERVAVRPDSYWLNVPRTCIPLREGLRVNWLGISDRRREGRLRHNPMRNVAPSSSNVTVHIPTMTPVFPFRVGFARGFGAVIFASCLRIGQGVAFSFLQHRYRLRWLFPRLWQSHYVSRCYAHLAYMFGNSEARTREMFLRPSPCPAAWSGQRRRP